MGGKSEREGEERGALTGSAATDTLMSYWLRTSAGLLVFSANCLLNYSRGRAVMCR